MSIRTELDNLQKNDVYSMLLFVLYQLSEDPEYSTLSELAYILDKDSLFKLCEYYGGLTIKLPTLKELDCIVCAMLMYKRINIDGVSFSSAEKKIDTVLNSRCKVVDTYKRICDIMKDFSFQKR